MTSNLVIGNILCHVFFISFTWTCDGILPRNLTFYYNGQQLEIVNKFRYLGVVFTAGVSFSECQKHKRDKHRKQFFSSINFIERVHLQFCKRLLGVKKQRKMILSMASWVEQVVI